MPRRQLDAQALEPCISAFLKRLHELGFEGDVETGLGARQVAATDNSIYELRPAAILYPRQAEDLNHAVQALAIEEAEGLSLTARGGNTGTNGQSLNSGIIVDFARHMNRILALDVAGGTVTVEPGVVLSQLNAQLADHGLFFPPTVSTASRATIGGMVGTDASGKGSRLYGKTSDYIEALDVVLCDGTDWRCTAISTQEAGRIASGEGLLADIHHAVLSTVLDHADEIASVFPDINRGLTGYNLQKTWDAATDQFNLAYLLAGSEGTLALTKAVTLRVMPKPAARALAILRYDDFQAGLVDVERLLAADPLAVEILDDKVLGVAASDIVWAGIEDVLGAAGGRPVKALNVVEFVGAAPEEVQAALDRCAALAGAPSSLIDTTPVSDAQTIARIWALREKAVGLLARLGGGRQGMPFVEDTAVPPGQLPAYVQAFRALLDSHGLHYGMFGHADVGCLHVRPFLDLKDPAQAALIRPISDAVAALTRQHGGLLWGEHGRGFRGEYSPFFFGPVLYEALVRIKAAFDPADRFNPGKLASPSGFAGIDRIDAVPLRGEQDRRIAPALIEEFDRAVACNGNGACFSWDALDALCPSYKATRDRAQSPKGRAALLRAWARLESSTDPAEQAERHTIEAATKQALATCLSCKACTTLCPVKVDVPTMKSRFLDRYHTRHGRPSRDRWLAHAERLFLLGRIMPALANRLSAGRLPAWVLERLTGLVDLPRFSAGLPGKALPVARMDVLERLDEDERARTLVLVEDSFTASFDAAVPWAARRLLAHLGYRLYRLAPAPNGKMLHLLGMRDAFAATALERVESCARLAATGVRLVGFDAVPSLMFEQEYREVLPETTITVMGLEAVLLQDIEQARIGAGGNGPAAGTALRLFGHCTENALRPQALAQWRDVLGHFGIAAQPMRSGCCGMAGLFGHEADKQDISRRLFALSWRDRVEAEPGAIVATGFSCREQTRRLAGFRPPHPVEILSSHLLERIAA
jgi:FAD/FMN-containing dehydrogenase/Fe-S oxidoreductase